MPFTNSTQTNKRKRTGVAECLLTAYTAFGERVMGPFQRYGFAGAWGYQSHADFPYLHLGHRYYNPATGRFLQRDPIGIYGGPNVYDYVAALPTGFVDPDGLLPAVVKKAVTRWGPIGVCGWLAIEFTERIIVPAIDDWTDRRKREGYEEINRPPPPPKPDPPIEDVLEKLKGLPGIGGG